MTKVWVIIEKDGSEVDLTIYASRDDAIKDILVRVRDEVITQDDAADLIEDPEGGIAEFGDDYYIALRPQEVR